MPSFAHVRSVDSLSERDRPTPVDAPREHRESEASLPSLTTHRISGEISVKIVGKTPCLEIKFLNFEKTGLVSLPSDVVGAFSELAKVVPSLTSTATRFALYDQARRMSLEGDFQHLPRVVHRFISFFSDNSGRNIQKWSEQLGTPLKLIIRDSLGNLIASRGPDEAPRLKEIKKRCAAALDRVSKDYLAVSRVEDASHLIAAAEKSMGLFSEAFRLRQLGFSNPKVAQILTERSGVQHTSNQICAWIVGNHLPPGIRNVLPEQRMRPGRSQEVILPEGPSKSFSYLLGVQIGRVAFEGTPEQVGIVHHSARVISRVKKALTELGFKDVPTFPSAPKDGLAQQEVRLRNLALNGALYEITYGYTRLPWSYLVTAAEKKEFVRGLTDSLAVVFREKITFTKAHAFSLFKELSVLMADLGIYGEATNGERARFTVSLLPDVQAFRKVVGRRYWEFDAKLDVAAEPRKKTHASVAEYRAYLHAKSELGTESATEIARYLAETKNIQIGARTVERWLKGGAEPLCVSRMKAVKQYREEFPHIKEQLHLAKSGVARSQIVHQIEFPKK